MLGEFSYFKGLWYRGSYGYVRRVRRDVVLYMQDFGLIKLVDDFQ